MNPNRMGVGTKHRARRCRGHLPTSAVATMDTQDVDANGNPKSLLDQIPQWLKSLHQMENELRNAARKGLLLRKNEAMNYLAQARQHLQQALEEAKGIEPLDGPRTPLRKEGEV